MQYGREVEALYDGVQGFLFEKMELYIKNIIIRQFRQFKQKLQVDLL